ncbi:hypothetical protein P7C71_g4843, partial [Lecanoromycetidae sp. Uapishka_2]
MTLYKNMLIPSYFQPSAKTSQNKRPLPEDTSEHLPAKRKSPGGSPQPSESTDEHESAEPSETPRGRLLHSLSRQQSVRATDKPVKPEPNSPTPKKDDEIALATSATSIPIHPFSDAASKSPIIPSSQSLASSSQRIVKNGEVRIRDSDEESGSDTSLEDLDELLALFKPSRGPARTQAPEVPLPKEADDVHGSNSKRKRRGRPAATNNDSPLSSARSAIPKTYKISLDSLAKQKKQYDASNAGVAQAKSALSLYDQRKTATGEKEPLLGDKGALEADLINVVMKDCGDEDDIGRLKTAIHRTEALQQGKSWSFFEDDPTQAPAQRDDFPGIGTEHRLTTMLNETSFRQQAFLSGYIEEYAKLEGLPDEILLWLMNTVCLESRDDLRHSYTAALSAADNLDSLLSPVLTVLRCVYKTITDSSLRLQLLQSIPALPPRLILLRRRLALAFFLQDMRILTKQPEDSINLEIIAQHLQDPQFSINNETNYAEVAANIGILNIGIDCGDPPSTPSTKQEETAFNRKVDNLALKIKAIFTQINDTGASHMKRTEAKETLEAFHSRLLFAVRTKPPPKKNMFGDSRVRSIAEMFKTNGVSQPDDVNVITETVLQESCLTETGVA